MVTGKDHRNYSPLEKPEPTVEESNLKTKIENVQNRRFVKDVMKRGINEKSLPRRRIQSMMASNDIQETGHSIYNTQKVTPSKV